MLFAKPRGFGPLGQRMVEASKQWVPLEPCASLSGYIPESLNEIVGEESCLAGLWWMFPGSS